MFGEMLSLLSLFHEQLVRGQNTSGVASHDAALLLPSVEKRVSFQQKTVHVDNFNMKPCFVFPLHLGVCFQMNRRSLTCCVPLQSPAAAQISSDFCRNTET